MTEALRQLCEIAASVVAPGDIVECGVYRGRSLAALLDAMPGRRAWGFDSFQGMPQPTERDPAHAQPKGGTVVASEDDVRATLGERMTRTTLVKGWYESTLRNDPLPDQIAFLHVDCDWYESVKIVLDVLEPRVAEGGVIAIDDWAAFEGSRLAVYHWIAENDANPWIRSYDVDQGKAYWIKGEMHAV